VCMCVYVCVCVCVWGGDPTVVLGPLLGPGDDFWRIRCTNRHVSGALPCDSDLRLPTVTDRHLLDLFFTVGTGALAD
jgi:hypothetical protein